MQARDSSDQAKIDRLRDAFAPAKSLDHFLQVMAQHADWRDGSLADQRHQFDLLGAAFAKCAETLSGDATIIDQIKCEVHTPAAAATDQAILFLHGGAYISGSARSHSHMTSFLSEAAGIQTISVDYRLAPDYPFPAGLEDALRVYKHITGAMGVSNVALAGDSAGGGLATCVALESARRSLAKPSCLVLFSPWLDLACSSPSCDDKADVDVILQKDALLQAGLNYAGALDPRDPRVSPHYDEVLSLPPLLVHVAGRDLLYDEQVELVARARDQGLSAESKTWPDMVHGWQFMFPFVEEGRESLHHAAAFIQEQLRS